MAVVLGQVEYEPIKPWNSGGAGFPRMTRQLEAASKTFKMGVPVKLVSGYLEECDFSGADIIYGFSTEAAHNLASSGVAQELSEGTPPNQTAAVITPVGAWPRDGRCGVYEANGETVFSIALKDGEVFTQALLASGTLYGLTKDGTTGHWFLDPTDTSGNNAVAILLGMDPSSPNTVAGGCRVFFKVDPTKRFFE